MPELFLLECKWCCSSQRFTLLCRSQKKASKQKCKKPYRDWSLVAFAALEPNPDALISSLPQALQYEVLAAMKAKGKAEAAALQLKGANHFTVFHTLPLSQTAALNKLVQV